MSAANLLANLQARGITLEPKGGTLRAAPREALTDALRHDIRTHKAELLALLEPKRDATGEDCPRHWQQIPELPPKGAQTPIGTAEKPARYRVSLFGRWYIVRFEPTISETTVSVTDSDKRRRMFADLSEFYRWAWAEHYAHALTFKEVN